MRIPSRVSATIVVLALAATACGGDNAEEAALADQNAELADQNAELQEQFDEISERIEQQAEDVAALTSTTSAPEQKEDAPEVADTTEVPELEPVEEESAEPVESPEKKPDEPSTDAGTPSSDVLNASLGPTEAAALVVDIVGPTADLAGQVSRIDAAWPAISTMPNTDLRAIKSTATYDFFKESWAQRTSVEFFTTATPEDVVLAYQSELAELVEGRVSNSTSEDDGTVRYLARIGHFDIFAQELRGATFVDITSNGGLAIEAPAALEESLAGVVASAPVADGAVLESVRIWNFLDIPEVEIGHRYIDVTEEEADAILAKEAAAAGWSLTNETDVITEYSVPDIDAGTQVFVTGFDNAAGVFSKQQVIFRFN